MFNSLSFVQIVIVSCVLFGIFADIYGLSVAIVAFLGLLLSSVLGLVVMSKKHNEAVGNKFLKSDFKPLQLFRVNRNWTSVSLLVMEKDRLILLSTQHSDKIVPYQKIKEIRTAKSKYYTSLKFLFVLNDDEKFIIELDQMNTKEDASKVLLSKHYQSGIAMTVNGLSASGAAYAYAASDEVAAQKVQKLEKVICELISNKILVSDKTLLKNELRKNITLSAVALLEIISLVIIYTFLVSS